MCIDASGSRCSIAALLEGRMGVMFNFVVRQTTESDESPDGEEETAIDHGNHRRSFARHS